jgi:hypothetical protein
VSFHRLDGKESVGGAVLSHVGVLQNVVGQRFTIDAKDAVSRVDPERAAAIVGEAENRSAEHLRRGASACE